MPETPPTDPRLASALAEARRLAGAELALVYASYTSHPLTCVAADAGGARRWSATANSLLGTVIQPDQQLANARRQHRTITVPAAELPATSNRGVRFASLDLPAWATVVPLRANATTDGLLVLLRSGEAADASLVSVAVEHLVRLLAHLAETEARGGDRMTRALGRQERAVEQADAVAESLNLLLSALREGVVVTDGSGTVVAANGEGSELLALLQDGETGRICNDALLGTHRDVLADRAPEEVELSVETEPRRYLHVTVAAAPAADTVLLTLRDVSEEHLLQERLLQSEKMASIGQLVSGVAHELNNPLTGIMGFAQLLLMRDLPEQARREVQTIHDEAERASRIVQNLLSFARRRRPEKERVNLNELVERVFELRGYDLRVHNIEPRLRLQPDLRPVLADPHQIQQVLLNIIRNAEHAVQERGGSGTITCSTADDADWVRVTIADDGIGIAKEHLRRVFDPFFTTKQVGEGTGLGLTISYGIVEEHGGLISIYSPPGRGTIVKIQLPPAAGASKRTGRSAPRAGRRQPPKRSVLVIEDEPSIRQLLTAALMDDGHEIEAVVDGRAGLERLAARDFDLIITDIKMPGIDGIEFYERVKAWDADVAARIIFMTGDMVNPTTRDFLESAGNPYLPKPFRIADVKNLVTAMLPK